MVIVSMVYLDFGCRCKPTFGGSRRGTRGETMRQEIIAFATSMYPDVDTLTALEMLLLAVYATIDGVLFAQEEAKQYAEQYPDAEQYPYEVWDYVY